jgi:hypothetical protein
VPLTTIGTRSTHVRIDEVLLFVKRIFSGPESHSFDDGQHTSLLTRSGSALKFLRLEKLTLDAKHGLLYSTGFDLSTRSWMETSQSPFRNSIRSINGAGIGGFEIVLAYDVDDAFTGLDQIS